MSQHRSDPLSKEAWSRILGEVGSYFRLPQVQNALEAEKADRTVTYEKDDARRVAEAYLQQLGRRVVTTVYSLEELPFRAPPIDVPLESCWIVYVEGPPHQVGSSQIVVVSKQTGVVAYAGHGND